jgi:flagellar basal body rod protein FlgG
MIYGLYLSAAGLQAQELRQSVLANNLANAETPGFKRDLAVMRSRMNAAHEDPAMSMYRLPVVGDQGGGVYAMNGGIDLSQAPLKATGNPTDVALDGRGFFTVQGEKPGQTLLTRNGTFLLDHEGTLVTADGGRPVLSSSGEPVKLNPDLPVKIDAKGVITQGDATGVPLGLTDVTDSRHLIKLGNNLLATDDSNSLTPVAPGTIVRQGQVESSGVEPMVEMVNMMEGQRAFEANAHMITFQDTTMSQLNTIGRVA